MMWSYVKGLYPLVMLPCWSLLKRVFVVDLNSTNGTFVLESGLPRQTSFSEISSEATIQLGTVQVGVGSILEGYELRGLGEYTTVLDLDSGQLVRRPRQ